MDPKPDKKKTVSISTTANITYKYSHKSNTYITEGTNKKPYKTTIV